MAPTAAIITVHNMNGNRAANNIQAERRNKIDERNK